jgi:hypothetical protein
MAIQVRRREFIVTLASAATWPVAARTQQSAKRPIIGLVSIGASPTDLANFRPFLAQMRELGYVDGQNVTFDRRFAAGVLRKSRRLSQYQSFLYYLVLVCPQHVIIVADHPQYVNRNELWYECIIFGEKNNKNTRVNYILFLRPSFTGTVEHSGI